MSKLTLRELPIQGRKSRPASQLFRRDWPDLNRRPSASDLCKFPHSLDYSFTLDGMSLGGGRYVVDFCYFQNPLSYLQPVSAPSLPEEIELGSRLPYPLSDLGFLEFDHIHS